MNGFLQWFDMIQCSLYNSFNSVAFLWIVIENNCVAMARDFLFDIICQKK